MIELDFIFEYCSSCWNKKHKNECYVARIDDIGLYVCKINNTTNIFSLQTGLLMKLDKYIEYEKLSEEYIDKLLMLI